MQALQAMQAETRAAPGQHRGIDLLTGPEGEIAIAIGPVAQLYSMVDQILSARRILALPIAEKYGLAGKVAAVPDEHPRLVERLLAGVSSSPTEAGSLNALYLIETCKELVPGFKDKVPEERLVKAAEMSPHQRTQAVMLLGQKPAEWTRAESEGAGTQIMLLHHEEEKGILEEAGEMVGDGARFVSGTALGGVGAISDGLGITRNAHEELTLAGEDAVDLMGETVGDAVDLVGDTAYGVVEAVDGGIDGTADDFHEKGVAGAVGDGMADAVDLVSDFVEDAVHGVAGGVRWTLNQLAGEEEEEDEDDRFATHKVLIQVGELFGAEKSLGLRLENRIVTKLTMQEATILGWKLGDTIVGMASGPVNSQEELLTRIGLAKHELKTNGVPMKFVVERIGRRPADPRFADV